MAILESILFGIIQGVTEWFPISSTGQLMILMVGFFGYTIEQATKFSIFLHLGTSIAAIIYFREDLRRIFSGLRTYRPNFRGENRLTSFLLITTLISGSIGYFFFKFVQTISFSGEILLAVIGIALIATGIVQKFMKSIGRKNEKDLGLFDSLLLGVAQAFSAIPGLSRSGITVSALLFRGYNAKDALRLSFLMGIPAILAAQVGLGVFEGLPNLAATEILFGLAFSFVFGLLSIHFLLKLASRIKFWIFTIVIGGVSMLPLIVYL